MKMGDIEPILENYVKLFHDENYFKCTNEMEHQIQVGEVKSIRKPPYSFSYAMLQEMQN